MRLLRLPALVAAITVASTPVLAEEESAVTVDMAIPVEVQYDRTYRATDDDAEGSDLFTTIEPEIGVGLPQGFSIQAGLTFESLREREPREHRTFKSHGLYVRTLQVMWEAEPFTLHAGKFAPVFQFDGGHARGMYADTFMGDYELVERLGVGGSVEVPVEGIADITVAASLFTRDRSFLGKSLVTSRERLRLSDGTPGNTRSLENGTIALDLRPQPHPELLLRASFLRQGKGRGDEASQTAWGLGADYEFAVSDDVVIAPMIDWVHGRDAWGFAEAESIDGARTDTVTTGVQVTVGPWFGTVSQGWRSLRAPSEPDQSDRFTQVSVGYEFDFGLGVEAGWMRLHEAGERSSTVGAKAAYTLEF